MMIITQLMGSLAMVNSFIPGVCLLARSFSQAFVCTDVRPVLFGIQISFMCEKMFT